MAASDLFDLSGKVGLVTGANSGLGLGFASGMARCGADVVIWGRREDKNAEAAEQLRKLGARRVRTDAVDVSREAEVVEGIANAIREMGRLDCVVANAGFADMVPFHELDTARYDALLAVNQHGVFFTLREAVKHMKARADAGDPGGSLILCGSLSIFLGVPRLAHYAAAKGAAAAMIRSIAAEYGRDGIRANIVAAGTFYTGFLAGVPEDSIPITQALRERNPIPGWGYPQDLEGITAYLMSDSSRFHTGDLIVIDGGQSIRVLS
jgi:NAD(P)-dependent dehydrogenase (short-subunit alcohol dehydrogenase family)